MVRIEKNSPSIIYLNRVRFWMVGECPDLPGAVSFALGYMRSNINTSVLRVGSGYGVYCRYDQLFPNYKGVQNA